VASKQILGKGVYIYSSDFRLIKTVSENSDNLLELTLTELTDGMYYLVLETDSGQKIKKIEKICR
jgi:hypothetical protein